MESLSVNSGTKYENGSFQDSFIHSFKPQIGENFGVSGHPMGMPPDSKFINIRLVYLRPGKSYVQCDSEMQENTSGLAQQRFHLIRGQVYFNILYK